MSEGLHHVDALAFVTTMADQSVDVTITDPPYDLPKPTRMWLHGELQRISRHGIFVFCPPEDPWTDHADQYLFWIKPTSPKNTAKRYARFVEMILVYGAELWNTGRHWSQYTNVFHDLVEGDGLRAHEKPRSLIRRLLLLNHTRPGDIVFDPFAGGGTIPAVALELRRRFIACEKDRHYYRAAAARLIEGAHLNRNEWGNCSTARGLFDRLPTRNRGRT